MWVWWVVSLIILIACIIFAYRMIVSSYEFLPADKRYFIRFNKNYHSSETLPAQRDSFKALKNQVQSVEDNSTFYAIQFSKLQERLKALEEQHAQNLQPKKSFKIKDEEEEDWKELYFEENEKKEKLENELDATKQMLEELQHMPGRDSEDWKELYYSENTVKENLENEVDLIRQKLEEAEKKLNEPNEDWKKMYYSENAVKQKLQIELDLSTEMLEASEKKLKMSEKNNSHWVQLQSNYDGRLNDIKSIQNNIEILHRQLSASEERENELEQLLISEITVRERFSALQSQYVQLQSETDDLRRRVLELNKQEINLEIRVTRFNEIENKLSICEEENVQLKSRLKIN